MEMPKSLREVKEKGLPGFELKTGYFLQLKHGLWGTFPALIAKDNKLFFCVDKKILEDVWEILPQRQARLTKVEMYVNTAANIGFIVSVGDDAEPVHILSRSELDELKRDKNPFKWSLGLLSLKDEGEIASPFM